MTDFYLLETPVGKRSLPGDAHIYVQLKDGSYTPVAVKHAKKYAGRSKTIFERKHIDVEFTELEKIFNGS